jgi:predicted GTPase/uncharacterized protein (DUF697 family)
MQTSTQDNEFPTNLEDIVAFIRNRAIVALPPGIREKAERYLEEMEELLSNRAPRFGIVGRRGAGKSSLVNAMFGEKVSEIGAVVPETERGKWHVFKSSRGELEILDTRGLGEGTKSSKETGDDSIRRGIENSLKEKCPDAILFLVKAKEVAARIDEDLREVQLIVSNVEQTHSYPTPVIGIVTQVDELDPPEVCEPPFDDDEKKDNIEKARTVLEHKMNTLFPDKVPRVVAVCAYMRFKVGAVIVDRRWQIDILIEYLGEALPKSTHIQVARLAKLASVQKKIAWPMGRATAALTAAIAAIPIPIADILPITALQITMVSTIAYISGRSMSKETAAEFIVAMGVTVGTGYTLRTLARQLLKLFPGGSLVSGPIAYAGTMALCKSAIAYFIEQKSAEEAKRVFETAKAEEEKKENDSSV